MEVHCKTDNQYWDLVLHRAAQICTDYAGVQASTLANQTGPLRKVTSLVKFSGPRIVCHSLYKIPASIHVYKWLIIKQQFF